MVCAGDTQTSSLRSDQMLSGRYQCTIPLLAFLVVNRVCGLLHHGHHHVGGGGRCFLLSHPQQLTLASSFLRHSFLLVSSTLLLRFIWALGSDLPLYGLGNVGQFYRRLPFLTRIWQRMPFFLTRGQMMALRPHALPDTSDKVLNNSLMIQ